MQDNGTKADPATILNAECMLLIFSFVGGNLSSDVNDNVTGKTNAVGQDPDRNEETASVDGTGNDGVGGDLEDSSYDDEDEESDDDEDEEEASVDGTGNENATDSDDSSYADEDEDDEDEDADEDEDEDYVYFDHANDIRRVLNAAGGLCFKEAARFYYNLSTVSRGWKEIMDKSIYHLVKGGLKVDLSGLEYGSEASLPRSLEWLCRHSLSIVSIKGPSDVTPTAQFPFQAYALLMEQLLRKCDTTQLTALMAYVPTKDGISQREFHDLIAEQCPNLKAVCVYFQVNGDETHEDHIDLYSKDLFTMATIERLFLWIEVDQQDGSIGHHLVNLLTAFLPSLDRLYLRSSKQTILDEPVFILSASLRSLSVQAFCEQVRIFVACPQLSSYNCSGSLGGVPGLTIALKQMPTGAWYVPNGCVINLLDVRWPEERSRFSFNFPALEQHSTGLLPLGMFS